MKRSVLYSMLISIALLTMIAAPAMAADTIKIAYIDPLSGAFAGVGDAGYKHFQYNAELINAKGGVLGGNNSRLYLSTTKSVQKRPSFSSKEPSIRAFRSSPRATVQVWPER